MINGLEWGKFLLIIYVECKLKGYVDKSLNIYYNFKKIKVVKKKVIDN